MMKWCDYATKSCLIVLVLGIVLNGVVKLKRAPLTHHLRKECRIPAIYNFGDSNSDTGSNSAAFGRATYPNGITFFGKPAGRICDGRLIIDFVADKLGLPYLSAYLDAIEANFEHGANFGAYGATIQPADHNLYENGANPFALNIQLLQFHQLKQRAHELHEQGRNSNTKTGLPRPLEFSDALYTFDIGQNDIDLLLKTMTEDQARQSLPDIVNYFAFAILKLHQEGARRFWIHNIGPFGCLPINVENYPTNILYLDDIGCVKSYNDLAQDYNRQLKEKVHELRAEFQDSVLVYVDIYSAKYSVIKDGKKNGFVDPFSYCCRKCARYNVAYWNRKIVNETQVDHPTPCENPWEYISWDGVHFTEASNHLVANQIFNESLTHPPLSIAALCM